MSIVWWNLRPVIFGVEAPLSVVLDRDRLGSPAIWFGTSRNLGCASGPLGALGLSENL